MDQVLCDFCGPFTNLYNKTYDDDLSVETLCSDWYVYKRAKCGKQIYDLFDVDGFYLSLPQMPGAIAGFNELSEMFNVKIVTSISGSANAAKDKVLWLKQYAPFFDIDNLVMAHCKGLLRGDVMIDDRWKNLEQFQCSNQYGTTVMFEAPHNKGSESRADHYVRSWAELMTLMRGMYDRYVEKLCFGKPSCGPASKASFLEIG